MAQSASIVVHAFWDEEAGVWVAQSDDVPGLVTEADTTEALLAKLKVMIPELLEENDGGEAMPEVPFSLMLEELRAVRHDGR